MSHFKERIDRNLFKHLMKRCKNLCTLTMTMFNVEYILPLLNDLLKFRDAAKHSTVNHYTFELLI